MNLKILKKLLEIREAAHGYEDYNAGVAYELEQAISEELSSGEEPEQVRTLVPAWPVTARHKDSHADKVRVKINGATKWVEKRLCKQVPCKCRTGFRWALLTDDDLKPEVADGGEET